MSEKQLLEVAKKECQPRSNSAGGTVKETINVHRKRIQKGTGDNKVIHDQTDIEIKRIIKQNK